MTFEFQASAKGQLFPVLVDAPNLMLAKMKAFKMIKRRWEKRLYTSGLLVDEDIDLGPVTVWNDETDLVGWRL